MSITREEEPPFSCRFFPKGEQRKITLVGKPTEKRERRQRTVEHRLAMSRIRHERKKREEQTLGGGMRRIESTR